MPFTRFFYNDNEQSQNSPSGLIYLIIDPTGSIENWFHIIHHSIRLIAMAT